MIVVADTTPVNYLILTGHIDILKDLFGQVIIPEAVHKELQHPKAPDSVRTWIATPPRWLEVKQADLSVFTPLKRLGPGESEAIALAITLNAEALLLDDKEAGKEAVLLNLPVVKTLGLLELAAEKELLDLPQALQQLAQTSFRAPADLIQELLDKDAERRKQKQGGGL